MTPDLTIVEIAELRKLANSSRAQRFGLSGVISLDEFHDLLDSAAETVRGRDLAMDKCGEFLAERDALAASLAKVRELIALPHGYAETGALIRGIQQALGEADVPTETPAELERGADAPTEVGEADHGG